MRFYRPDARRADAGPSSSASAAASRRCPPTRASISLDAVARRRRRGRAQRQRVDPRSRRRRLLPRVPLEDERARPRHRGDDDAAPSTAPSATAWALVIGNDAPDAFCAGREPVLADGRARPGQLRRRSTRWSRTSRTPASARATRACRWSAAPFGLALGGGAEVVLGCQTVRAAAELYVGCVEVGVGLIPAGGGCMEMAARASARATDDPAVRSAGAGARAVRDAGPRARVDQRRGGARPRLPAPAGRASRWRARR